AAVADPGKYRSSPVVLGDPRLVDAAARLIENAQRPALLAGSQMWSCRGAAALESFVKKTGIPTYLNGSARGLLPPGHPNLFNRSRREALARADVVLVIGTPFDFRLAYGKRFAADARII